MTKQTRIVTVKNRHGLHIRAASKIAEVARQFPDADLTLVKGHQPAEASSVWAILALGAWVGDELVLEASGSQAQEALDALERLFINRFDIDETDQNPDTPG